jgi:hypothetical protein
MASFWEALWQQSPSPLSEGTRTIQYYRNRWKVRTERSGKPDGAVHDDMRPQM